MLTSKECLKVFGNPTLVVNQSKYMKLLTLDANLLLHFKHVYFTDAGKTGFPNKIYCNTLLHKPLVQALTNLIARGFASEMQTYDGCFNIRTKRGASSWSMHAWGLAIDVNRQTNDFGAKPTLSKGFVKCFTDAGFDWGGLWTKQDGMHFQLKTLK